MNVHTRILRKKVRYIKHEKALPSMIHLGRIELDMVLEWARTTPRYDTDIIGGMHVVPVDCETMMACS